MAIEKIDVYFNSIAETYDKRMERPMTDEDGYVVRTVAEFPEQKDMRVLNLGCGTGMELLPLLARDDTLRFTAVDCADQMLDKLKVNLAEYKDRVQTICGDFFEVDLGSDVYDCAMSVMALHYYTQEQKLALFKRVRTALKANSTFILTDKFAPAQGYEDYCRNELEKKKAAAHLPDGHYYCFTPLTVSNEVALLFKAGFSEVQVRWAKSNTAVLVAKK